MIKRAFFLLSMVFSFFAFVACENLRIETDVTALMHPPTLSQEQGEIYSLIEEFIGTTVKLKYPQSGDYRSAIVFYDLDGDNNDEVLVFYEAEAEDRSGLRIAFLDKFNDKWQVVTSIPGAGNDIIKIDFIELTEGVQSLVVEYKMQRFSNHLSVYAYKNNKIITQKSGEYSAYVSLDAASGDTSKRLAILSDISGMKNSVNLEIVAETAPGLLGTSMEQSIVSSFSSYIMKQDILESSGKNVLYIDAVDSDGILFTQVFLITDNEILLVETQDAKNISVLSRREFLIPTMDLFDENKYYVPMQDTEQVLAVLTPGENKYDLACFYWGAVSESELEGKYPSVYNRKHGYFYVLPNEWTGKAVIKFSDNGEEMIISLAGVETGNEIEVLRIWAVPTAQDGNVAIPEGYLQIWAGKKFIFYKKTLVTLESGDKFEIYDEEENENLYTSI